MNADFFKEAYPAIIERFGGDQELEIEIELRDSRVEFGIEDAADITFFTTVSFKFKLANSRIFILYDQLDLLTGIDLSVDQEILFGQL